MNLRTYVCFLIIILLYHDGDAQNKQIDSMKNVLSSAKEDTNKVNTLIELSKKYISSTPNVTINLATQAKVLAEKINYPRGEAFANKYIGIGYFSQGTYLEALQFWEKALAKFDTVGDRAGVANMYNNMANVYYNKGDNLKAIELYLKSLKIAEEINDTLRITSALLNIGAAYSDKEQTYDKSLQYLHRALPLSKLLTNPDRRKENVGAITVNLGEIYFGKKNYDSALYYFNESVRTYGEESEYVPYSLNDIGKLYTEKGEYHTAIRYHEEAVEKSKKIDSKLDLCQSLIGLGSAYEKQNEFKPAVDAYAEAKSYALEINAWKELKDIYEGLANSYSGLKDFGSAFSYHRLYAVMKDTLYNIDRDKKLGGIQFDFDLAKKQNQLDLKELDLKKQRIIKNLTIGGLSVVMMFLVVVFFQKKRITKEKKRSDELLLNILPEETAEELKATGTAKAKSFDMVSVLFTDFKNFTQASEKLSPEELVEEINHCYSEFDRIITKYNIEKIKTIGDAYMCAGGLPVPNSTHAEDVIRAGLEMQEFILKNKKERMEKDQPFFELRLGIHTGPVVAGIVGIKKFAYDIWGDTVNTASRMESSGEIGKVNISGTTYEIVKDKFRCTHRGKVQAKNKGEIDMYFVEGVV
ncbi:MAG: tetratricopeptide repeat protein [Bacteroidetes bacterium]|nr:tetratricopeptide repeat protein [Bacteroidota bacterium]